MRILIVYATNSGSTFLVAQTLSFILSKKHRITVQKAEETQAEDFSRYDGVLLGTPSWKVEGHEGYPLPAMLALLRAAEGADCSRTWFALFGCGDSSYTYLCGALNVVQEFVDAMHGRQVTEPLKIDGYYFDLPRTRAQVEEWGRQLLVALKKV